MLPHIRYSRRTTPSPLRHRLIPLFPWKATSQCRRSFADVRDVRNYQEYGLHRSEAWGAPITDPSPDQNNLLLEGAGPPKTEGRGPSVETLLAQRMQRLPRSRLLARSKLEQDHLDQIQGRPTYKTARRDVSLLFRKIEDSRAVRRAAIDAAWKERLRRGRIDWIPVAKKLLLLPPKSNIASYVESFELSETFIKYYVGPFNTNMWIMEGAEVYLQPPDEGSRGNRKLAMRGDPRSVRFAQKALREKCEYFQLAGKLEKAKPVARRYSHIRSPNTFAYHINQRIRHVLPHQVLRDTGESMHESIAGEINRLFFDPRVSKHASVLALRCALQFLWRFDDMTEVTESLYQRAKGLRLKLDTGIFNLLIKQAVRHGNETRVMELINDMQQASVPVDGSTFMILLAAVNSHKARMDMVSIMKEGGINLDAPHLSSLFERVIVDRIRTVQDSEEDFASMMDEISSRFGRGWMNHAVYQSMVHGFLSRRARHLKKLPELLLNVPKEYSLDINPRIQILRFQLHRHLRAIDPLLDEFCELLQKEGENQTRCGRDFRWHVIYAFMTAWNTRRVNLCRVLWMYAASHGNIFRMMLKVVSKSMIHNLPVIGHSSDWWRHAGSLIAGTDLNTTGFDSLFPRLSKACSNLTNVMEWVNVWTPDDGTRDEQISVAYTLIGRDLNAWKRTRPMRATELLTLLTLAREKDRHWQQNNLFRELAIQELQREIIQVPLPNKEVASSSRDVAADFYYGHSEATGHPNNAIDRAAQEKEEDKKPGSSGVSQVRITYEADIVT